MKHETETRRLVDLLMAGEINPAEQRRLKTLLSAADLDEELTVYREMMEWMDRPLPEPTDEELSKLSEFSKPSKLSRMLRLPRMSRFPRMSALSLRPVSRVAAMLALIICIGAAAATITYRVVVEMKASSDVSENSVGAGLVSDRETDGGRTQGAPLQENSDSCEAPKDDVRLPEALAFDNQSLAEIGRRISEIFGCKVEFADDQSATLRLYFTVPKGSTLADFVRIIDQYDALEASLKDNIVTIKREEAEQ